MIVHAAFALADVPVETELVGWDDMGWSSQTLKDVNPLGQVPTLVLPDGQVMTESSAMLLHLKDIRLDLTWIPDADSPIRTQFLHWLMFLNAAVYPTFTYGDVPGRWVAEDEAAAKLLRQGTNQHRESLYQYMEAHSGQPWFLGETMTAVDFYFMTMRFWRPGLEWFAEHYPKLDAIGLAVNELPVVKDVIEGYFPEG